MADFIGLKNFLSQDVGKAADASTEHRPLNSTQSSSCFFVDDKGRRHVYISNVAKIKRNRPGASRPSPAVIPASCCFFPSFFLLLSDLLNSPSPPHLSGESFPQSLRGCHTFVFRYSFFLSFSDSNDCINPMTGNVFCFGLDFVFALILPNLASVGPPSVSWLESRASHRKNKNRPLTFDKKGKLFLSTILFCNFSFCSVGTRRRPLSSSPSSSPPPSFPAGVTPSVTSRRAAVSAGAHVSG